jgi:hypothetical protein
VREGIHILVQQGEEDRHREEEDYYREGNAIQYNTTRIHT